MPVGWFMFSTASSRLVEEHREDPEELEQRVSRILESVGAHLMERLYFEVGREVAHAHVKDFDLAPPAARKAVLTTLGATYRKLLTPEETRDARDFERRLATGDVGGPEATAP
jgi:hypothetical protein